MSINELFNAFLAGRQLPTLGTAQARALLDMARNALLQRGITPPPMPPTDNGKMKAAMIEMHRLLTGKTEVYAQAGKGSPLSGLSPAQVDAIMTEHQATGASVLSLIAKAQGYTLHPNVIGRPTASAKPTAARPAATPARPAAPVRPVAPAKPTASARPSAATATPAPSAAAIAAAILDETERRRVASMTKSRAAFNAMSPREKSAFCKSGGRITD